MVTKDLNGQMQDELTVRVGLLQIKRQDAADAGNTVTPFTGLHRPDNESIAADAQCFGAPVDRLQQGRRNVNCCGHANTSANIATGLTGWR
jgi:hypothetical protein